MAHCKASCLAVAVSLLCFHATPTSAVDFLKYKHWFYQWGENELHLESLETGPCAQAVRNYWNPNYPDPYRCEAALSCLLDNATSSAQQMLATSIVILGLMPTMLSTLGPSIAESAMLSWLLAFGSPSVIVNRIWTYDDPFATIERPTGRSWRNSATRCDLYCCPSSLKRRFSINVGSAI